ncbi:MAG: histidine phosphatase family protein [Deltaproteobacteria bacterium]|jgi:broad specificity phosphatase PhoE|nr:histidine phosphatase family protein [Deltaproteobacteria bacterium]
MSYLRLFCIRHGQTTAASGSIFNGWTDVDLSETGRRQLDQAASALKGLRFDAVWSSDLRRAVYGAKALAAQIGVELVITEEFRELNFGICEGLPFDEIAKRHPELAERLSAPMGSDFVFPGGESASSFRDRIRGALANLIERHPQGRVALFSHAGVGRAILANILEMDYGQMWSLQQDHASLNVIDFFPNGGLRIMLVNGYLGPEGYYQSGPGFERLAGSLL